MKESQFHLLMAAIYVAPLIPEKYHLISAVIIVFNLGYGLLLSYFEDKNERRKPRS